MELKDIFWIFLVIQYRRSFLAAKSETSLKMQSVRRFSGEKERLATFGSSAA